MGLFDGAFSPNMGWLGQVLQSRDPNDYAKLADAFGPGTPFQGPQGSYSDANSPSMLGRLGLLLSDPFGKQVPIPPIGQQWTDANQRNAARDQQSNPSMNPADYPGLDAFGGPSGSPPSLAPPITIRPAPNVGGISPGQANAAAAAANPPPQLSGQTLDQRAYGMPAIGGAPQMPPQAQSAMAQAPQQGGDFLGGLQNFSQNLQNNPGVGGIINAMRGVQTGQNYGGSTLQKTGTDPYTGQDTFAWVNPQTMTMNPATMSGPAGTGATAGIQSAMSLSPQYNEHGRDQAFLNALDPTTKSVVESILSGDSSTAGRNLQKYLPLATRAEQGFTGQTYQTRLKGMQDFYGGGKSSETMRKSNQSALHFGELVMDKMAALPGHDIPMLNAGENFIKTNLLGNGAQGNFEVNAHALADELSGMFKGAGISDAEIRAWESRLSPNMSPEQQRGMAKTLLGLYRDSVTALEKKRQESVGPKIAADKGPILGPEAEAALSRVEKFIGGQSPQQMSNPSEPTATGPNGQKIVLRNGQWVPMK